MRRPNVWQSVTSTNALELTTSFDSAVGCDSTYIKDNSCIQTRKLETSVDIGTIIKLVPSLIFATTSISDKIKFGFDQKLSAPLLARQI